MKKKFSSEDILKLLPTEQDCMLAGNIRKNGLPDDYDKVSYNLGFHQAYNWVLSVILKQTYNYD